MRKLGMLLAAAVAACTFAATADAKLTAAEQKWVTPLLSVWNIQNAGLHLVLQQASAKNALVAGSKPNNLALTKTLYALISCKTPTDLIKKAGTPISPRLAPFRDALNRACIHDANGAHDFAKAVGAVTKGNGKLAQSLLIQGVAEFKQGSAQVAKAYKSLVAIGGKNIFSA
jgi:hypothetical protein